MNRPRVPPDEIARRWSELSPLLDEALDLEAEASEEWLQRRVADPELRCALAQLVADSRRETLIDWGCDRHAQALFADNHDDASPSWLGRRLGPYRVVRLLGEGGMASVFLAERDDGGFEQQVAIKLLRHGMLDPYEQQRFLRERQILARLEHPLIARLIDGGLTSEGVPWFAMEVVDGVPLTDFCDHNRLDIEARLNLFLQVCEAVSHAHRALVVHRDLKPSNILVDRIGRLKLLDFGIARLVAAEPGHADATQTVAAQRRLTPAYAAPEQWQDDAVITTAADVYALGVLLHELLVGTRPERRDDRTLRAPSASLAADPDREARARQRDSQAATLRRRLSGDLDTIVQVALRNEAERRYPSVAELAADIQRHLDRRPVRARSDSLGYRLGRYLRRHQVGVLAVSLIVISILVGGITTLQQAEQARQAAQQARVEAQRTAAVKDFLLGLFHGAAPDQRRGREVTASELLDRGSANLSAQMAANPELRAELQLVLAGIYRELGQLDAASELLDRAGTAANDRAGLAVEVGRVAIAQTRYDEAEQAFRLALAELVDEDENGQRAGVHVHLAEVLAERERFDEAETHIREAIALDAGINEPLTLARDQHVLGTIAFKRGNLADAEAAMREALLLRRAALGDEHTQVAQASHELGVVLLQRGDVDGAEAAFGQALMIRRRLLGDEHIDTVTSLRNLGAVKRRQNQLDEAEALFREAAAVLRQLFPDGHFELAATLNSLAILAHERGQIEVAIDYLEQAIVGARQAYGENNANVATMQNNLAALLRANGELARAEQAQREAMTMLAATLGEQHHLYAVAINGLAFIELETGRVDAALDRFGRAAGIIEATLGAAHPDYAAALTGRAEAHLALGDTAAALTDAEQALAVVEASLPAEHPRQRRTRLVLAEVRAAAANCSDASTQVAALGEPVSEAERERLAMVIARCPQ